MSTEEPWIARNWRPTAAFVYLAICIMDFLIMPIYGQWISQSVSPERIFALAATLNGGAAQVEALQVLRDYHPWVPVTLGASGMFHIAFGAILGVTAWSRGNEKVALIDQENKQADLKAQNDMRISAAKNANG